MARAESTLSLQRGAKAPGFSLPDTVGGPMLDWTTWRAGRPCVLMFICNHCPYVLHLIGTIARLAPQWQARGVAVVAISSNDVQRYPQDAPTEMTRFAAAHGLSFPYLYDESQQVARAYGAACTPDFYLVDGDGRLAWAGRFDDATPGNARPVTGADLSAAIDDLLAGRPCDPQPRPSVGCSIKWKV